MLHTPQSQSGCQRDVTLVEKSSWLGNWPFYVMLMVGYLCIFPESLLLISMLWHRQAILKSKRDTWSFSDECRIGTQGLGHQIASRLNVRWQTDWPIKDQAKKLELDSPSLWSASIQPTQTPCQLVFATGSGDIRFCCCWFRCSGTGMGYSNRKETSCFPLLNTGFEPRVSDTKSPADWMPADKPYELSKIKLKNLNSIARPCGQRAFRQLKPPASWLSHMALAMYMFVVVDFDALAQARDIQIIMRQVVFLCWMQDSNPGSQTPNPQQTECPLTNRLSSRGSS